MEALQKTECLQKEVRLEPEPIDQRARAFSTVAARARAASRLRTCRCSVRVCIAANAKPLAVVAERCRFAGIAHVGALHCRLSIGCAHSEGGVNHSDGVVENA